MAPKQRVRIPPDLAGTLVFEADRTCCICRQRGRPVQIHHLDENPGNNSADNLVLLCLEDHHAASTKSSIGRTLDAGVIRRYRKEWLAIVRSHRRTAIARGDVATSSHDAMMEALACHEVRKLTLDLRHEWIIATERLEKLEPYANSWQYGDSLRAEIMAPLFSLVGATRTGMPPAVASKIAQLASAVLPIESLVGPAQKRLNRNQLRLFETASELGFSMAHDAIKYLKNLSVMADGVHLLWVILRYARVNKLVQMKRDCLLVFDRLLNLADEQNNAKARQWLEFERADALALDGDPLPTFAADLVQEIRQAGGDRKSA